MIKIASFTLISILAFAFTNLLAQEKPKTNPQIILKGMVERTGWKDFLYYTDDLTKINKKNILKLNKNRNYIFDVSKTTFKNAAILYFMEDTISKDLLKYGCYDEINLAAIRDYCNSYSLNKMILANDINVSFNCSASAGHPFSDEEIKLGGSYTYVNADTTFRFNLSTHGLAIFEANFQPTDKNRFNHSWGYWGYDAKKKELNLYQNYLTNEAFSTMQKSNYLFHFKITEQDGKYAFTSVNGKGKLTKN